MQLMVIQDSDRTKIGEIEAQAGMELANGYKVVKVNDKSAIAEHDGHSEKFFDPTSIFYTEAIAWGFSEKAGVDGRAENLAASVRKFNRGEEANPKVSGVWMCCAVKRPFRKSWLQFCQRRASFEKVSNYISYCKEYQLNDTNLRSSHPHCAD